MNLPTKDIKAVIKNSDGKILFLELKDGTFDLPSTLIKDGETEKGSLEQEIKERLGLNVVFKKLLGEWQYKDDQEELDITNYLFDLVDYPQEVNLDEEYVNREWLKPNEVTKFKLKYPSLCEALKDELEKEMRFEELEKHGLGKIRFN